MSSSQMAALFRLVKYYNLPSYYTFMDHISHLTVTYPINYSYIYYIPWPIAIRDTYHPYIWVNYNDLTSRPNPGNHG